MNDLEKSGSEYPSTSKLTKQVMTAVGCTVGGIIMLIIQKLFMAKGPFNYIIGGIVCAVGIGFLVSKDSDDKKAGYLISAIGLFALLVKLPKVGSVLAILAVIGGVGLIAMGIWNAIKFFIGLKKRTQ
ncbi:MAG: hypothetical protein FWF29_10940 [Treponema sp.]|nr:hypothetical protein [Treponema sp.]